MSTCNPFYYSYGCSCDSHRYLTTESLTHLKSRQLAHEYYCRVRDQFCKIIGVVNLYSSKFCAMYLNHTESISCFISGCMSHLLIPTRFTNILDVP